MNQLNRFIKISFICDNCQRNFKRDIVFSLASDLDQLYNYPTYCIECVKSIENKNTSDWNKIKKKSLGEVPQEASENIKAPETAPSDKRITGRTRQLNLKVREEIYWLLREIALKEKCLMTEILEKALELYQKSKKSFSENRKNETQNQPKISASMENFTSQKKLNQFKNELSRSCSFFGKDIKTQQEFLLDCPQPIFDKKKQLCRSHNRQVWKKFNKFLESIPSVSSTAAWLSTWEDSGDWKYFWDLGEKEENKKP